MSATYLEASRAVAADPSDRAAVARLVLVLAREGREAELAALAGPPRAGDTVLVRETVARWCEYPWLGRVVLAHANGSYRVAPVDPAPGAAWPKRAEGWNHAVAPDYAATGILLTARDVLALSDVRAAALARVFS